MVFIILSLIKNEAASGNRAVDSYCNSALPGIQTSKTESLLVQPNPHSYWGYKMYRYMMMIKKIQEKKKKLEKDIYFILYSFFGNGEAKLGKRNLAIMNMTQQIPK